MTVGILIHVLVNLIASLYLIVGLTGNFTWKDTFALILCVLFTPIPIVIVAKYLEYRKECKRYVQKKKY